MISRSLCCIMSRDLPEQPCCSRPRCCSFLALTLCFCVLIVCHVRPRRRGPTRPPSAGPRPRAPCASPACSAPREWSSRRTASRPSLRRRAVTSNVLLLMRMIIRGADHASRTVHCSQARHVRSLSPCLPRRRASARSCRRTASPRVRGTSRPPCSASARPARFPLLLCWRPAMMPAMLALIFLCRCSPLVHVVAALNRVVSLILSACRRPRPRRLGDEPGRAPGTRRVRRGAAHRNPSPAGAEDG